MSHLFANFLANEAEYRKAEAYWASLWEKTPPIDRWLGGWQSGWFNVQFPYDGNPIFSAVSAAQKKGIRIIQYEPSCSGAEIDFWMDTFGGSSTDPDAIRELVVACALSPESAQTSLRLMSAWIIGEIEIANPAGRSEGVATIQPTMPRWQELASDIGSAFLIPAA